MKRRKTRLRPLVVVTSLACVFVYCAILYGSDLFATPCSLSLETGVDNHVPKHLSLTADECTRIFPGLTREIDLAVSEGPFDLEYDHGRVLNGRIQDGRVSPPPHLSTSLQTS